MGMHPSNPPAAVAAQARMDGTALLAAGCTLAYPALLWAFNAVLGTPRAWLAPPLLLVCLALPWLALRCAQRPGLGRNQRRLALLAMAAPTLYVFLGVVQGLAGSPLPDGLVWVASWALLGLAAWRWAGRGTHAAVPRPAGAALRVLHGVGGGVLLLFVLFHIGNHLLGLLGPETHAAAMDLGRRVYRSPVVEPLLVALFLLQLGSGVRLAWRWSASTLDFHRAFQLGTGVYLAAFVLGHMNSVFVYARTVLGIPTDWAFATGGDAGLIHDAWNIRLVPHYTLGVFFVLAHLLCGLRVVLLGHGVAQRTADRLWAAGIALSALITIAVMAGMSWLRL